MPGSPEEVFLARLHAIDAAIAAGRSSPDIASREVHVGDRLLVAEMTFELRPPEVMDIFERLMRRHGLAPRRRRKQARLTFVAPEVFTKEVLAPQIAQLEASVHELLGACVQRAAGHLFRDDSDSSLQP